MCSICVKKTRDRLIDQENWPRTRQESRIDKYFEILSDVDGYADIIAVLLMTYALSDSAAITFFEALNEKRALLGDVAGQVIAPTAAETQAVIKRYNERHPEDPITKAEAEEPHILAPGSNRKDN